jgi:hypothetical protein
MKKYMAIVTCLLLIAGGVMAQEKKASEKHDYRKEPVWIEMINDPHVNYYEALEAFEEYWEGKTEPEEESELITEGKITEEQAQRMKEERANWTQAQRNEYERLKYHFKRFKEWKRNVKPYVQPDGRILTEQERMDIYNKTKGNR